ncbi:MAG: DUF393 domain-containing protein [Caldimonas sp.]
MNATLTLFYDAGCGVCSLEMANLRRRDVAGRLDLVDMSAADFDAGRHGFTAAALDAEIHAVRADGSVLRGMAALRQAYAEVGLGWLLWPTGAAALRPLFDAGYRLFARHRRPISQALAPLITRLADRRAASATARMAACAADACRVRAAAPLPEKGRTS